jgi:hypothetical protein
MWQTEPTAGNPAAGDALAPVALAALDYLRRGWSVIPIIRGGKRPLTRWRDYQDRRATPDEVYAWFRRWPDANVAIVTGAISGLVVLDVDAGHGGSASLQTLEQVNGALGPTPSVVSGGGGRHFYFAHPGTPVRNRAGIHPGIDLRGDGGYIVAPPSVHASGIAYRWARGHASPQVCPMPAWLMQDRERETARTRNDWLQLLRTTIHQGGRNHTVASLAGHLLRRGIDPQIALELLLGWNATRCRPPLPEAEVVRTVASIQRAQERNATRRAYSGSCSM